MKTMITEETLAMDRCLYIILSVYLNWFYVVSGNCGASGEMSLASSRALRDRAMAILGHCVSTVDI
jgi:hypothetical protein